MNKKTKKKTHEWALLTSKQTSKKKNKLFLLFSTRSKLIALKSQINSKWVKIRLKN